MGSKPMTGHSDDYSFDISETPRPVAKVKLRPDGRPFDAEIEAGELDDRGRPGSPWVARARALSRSNIVATSRRMCYPGRVLLLAIHRIDSKPVALLAKVHTCDYEADGMYRLDLDLLPLPQNPAFTRWIDARAGNG